MNWKNKAKIYHILERVPFSNELYYFLQRNVSKSLPRKAKPAYFNNLDWHLDNLNEHLGDAQNVRAYEFGAGWDLFYNIWLYAYGVTDQTVVDLNHHIKMELVAHEASRCADMKDDPRVNHVPDTNLNSVADLAKVGIKYLAPYDARNTEFEEGSFDLIMSTNTMEHIPFSDLADIMVESFRILSPGGIVSTKVDYADHYCAVDKSIGPHNFMLFDDEAWKPFNPDNHYQNRCRHSQYKKLFLDAGFEIVTDRAVLEYQDAWIPPKEMRADRFKDLSEDDLSKTAGFFCLRKPK